MHLTCQQTKKPLLIATDATYKQMTATIGAKETPNHPFRTKMRLFDQEVCLVTMRIIGVRELLALLEWPTSLRKLIDNETR